MIRYFSKGWLLLAMIAATGATASIPGRAVSCVGAFGNYYAEDSFAGGLTGVSMNRDLFDYKNDAYALAHCVSGTYVLVQKTAKNADLFVARKIVVEMIASDQKDTFEDVVEHMSSAGFIAGIHSTSDDSCICPEGTT